MTLNFDSFSSGQIGSKLWLCEELEKLFDIIDTIWVYGGWYGVLPLLLKTRNNIHIGKIRSYDIDPSCEIIADKLNEYWVWQDWKFKAHTEDCNNLQPFKVDLIVNTAIEHFESDQWWNNIPSGTTVALQSNNMPHSEHHSICNSLDEFIARYPVSQSLYQGQLKFKYPNWEFTRFMVIGLK
jgi:hypothetical protein